VHRLQEPAQKIAQCYDFRPKKALITGRIFA
jgi:hypothetical protein